MAAAAQPTDFVALDRSFNTMLMAGENVRQQINGLSRLPQVEQSGDQIHQEIRAMNRNLNSSIERLDTRLSTLDTRLSTLETTVATIQAYVATIKTDVATIQTNMGNQNSFLEAQAHNQVARMINAARSTESPERPLEKIRDSKNIHVDGFPELVGDLPTLTNHAVGRMLRFYSVSDQGSHAEKVARFAMFCGVRRVLFLDSW